MVDNKIVGEIREISRLKKEIVNQKRDPYE